MDAYSFGLALGQDASVDTNLRNELLVPNDGTIWKLMAHAKTGPVGADLIFDINKNGTSIWNTTQGNRLTIADGANEATPQTTIETTDVAENDNITIDIDQIGSTTAGQDITVQMLVVPDWVYFGGKPDEDGTGRIGIVAGEIRIEKRISSTWTKMQGWQE